MSRLRLVGRLAVRDLRGRPAQAVLLLFAIMTATATLTLGLALRGVTSQPYQQTRAATNGPDLFARLAGAGDGAGSSDGSAAPSQAQVRGLVRLPGVTRYSGPFPIASVVLRAHGLAAGVEAEGRNPGSVPVDQPELTAGHWMGAGGIVLERTFATALAVGVGDRVTLNGRSFLVTGIAVTAAETPYPNLCYVGCVFDLSSRQFTPGDIGLAWVTTAAARAMATRQAPLYYAMYLRLYDPATAPALAHTYSRERGANGPWLSPWQQLQAADGLLVTDEQQVLSPGAWLAGLLAVASVAVLAGGRMAERTRRVGLLKAVGGTPGLVTAVLLAENLILAALAAGGGLVTGWLAAPLITSPGAGLIGAAGAPSLTAGSAGLVLAVAFAVALVSTLGPAVRAARTSTVTALASAVRPPKRRATLTALSAGLPVPLLLGLRMAARRPWRAALGAASVAVTVSGIVAVLAFHATLGSRQDGSGSLGNPGAACG